MLQVCSSEKGNLNSSSSYEMPKLIQEAEDLFDAALFSEAIPLYQKILQMMQTNPLSFDPLLINKIQSEVRFRLAQALFLTKDYKSAVALLEDLPFPINHQLLLGTAYKNNGEYDQAIEIFKSYLRNLPQSGHRDEAAFELALTFYLKGEFSKAQALFEEVQIKAQDKRLKILSHFYLVRIKISENNLEDAEHELNKADILLSDQDLLNYESAYLRGTIFFKKGNFEKAATYFQSALPQYPHRMEWHNETLYHLGMSYLKLSDLFPNTQEQLNYLEKTKEIFESLTALNFSEKTEPAANEIKKKSDLQFKERIFLAYGEYFLKRGRKIKDEEALKKADEIFSEMIKSSNQESSLQALLQKTQTHLSYVERDRRLRQLTQNSQSSHPAYAKAWYLRGVNDFEEAKELEKEQKVEEARKTFERAAASLQNAIACLRQEELDTCASAILMQAEAYGNQPKALDALLPLWEEKEKFLKALKEPLEAYILYGHIAAGLSEEFYTEAILKLQQGLSAFPKSPLVPSLLYALGILFYKTFDYENAEKTFIKLAEEWPESSLGAEALFRASQCAEKSHKDTAVIKEYKENILKKYPSSSIAPEAYFTLFSYQEYLQGDRTALKHLNAFPDLYPESPYVLNTFFLIGLDQKRDRRSPEGKWLRKKNLISAIDHFQKVDIHFESLFLKKKIPEAQMEHYLLLRYRSQLEKGLAHFVLANESAGAKKQIYLEYAQETLTQLLHELRDESNIYRRWITLRQPFWHLEEEIAFGLSQVYMASKENEQAEKLLTHMLEKYKAAKITRGYFLSRILAALGEISIQNQHYSLALDYFSKAEDAAKGKILNTDQRLSLLIEQSFCLQKLNEWEKAILILSKVVNDDAISSLRVKALYLRAEIYEKQGRLELARKQLEATSKKGGEWALKAKEKLEKNYGYR